MTLMGPIRVLVVDDSVVIRKLLSDTLSGDAALEVVGVAGDGRIALSKIPLVKPDLVTLDIEMPVMNGLETLTAIRQLYPKLPVIMFSTLTERGASATLDALALGASDYASKPSNVANPATATERIRTELIPKIKALCGRDSIPSEVTLPHPIARAANQSSSRIDVVAIGVSTGGPNALAEVLPRFAGDFPVPIVLVQHMPPIFTRLLAERLSSRSAISVEEGCGGTILEPGHAWIAPGDFHMRVVNAGMKRCLSLNQAPPENSCRPAVDVLFRSLAASYGANVLGVIMTGMGSDGLLGCQAICEAGGHVIVQDEATSAVWGMPGLVFASGLSDAAFPLSLLAHEISRRVFQSRNGRPPLDLKSYAARGASNS
jgi:two-component system, chemotaxis family, protein-glutamate methylesterase/glutaminase